MVKVKKASKKLDIKGIKKQRRFNKKVIKSKQISDKSMANFKEDVEESEEELELEVKEQARNTQIDSNDNGEEVDSEEEDDEEEEEDEEEVDYDLDENEKKLSNKKDKKEIIKDSENTKSLKQSISQHKQDLETLKLKDPKLFEFLSENDKELLSFTNDVSEDEDDEDDEDDEEPEGDEKESKPKKTTASKDILTSALLDSWVVQAQKETTVQSVKKLVVAFRCAARTGGEDVAKLPFKIVNSAVFNRTLIVCLQNIPIFFDKILEYNSQEQGEDEPNNKVELPNISKKWASLHSCTNSFIKSFIHLLTQVGETKLLLLILKGLEKIISYVACFPKYSKVLLKNLLQQWSTSPDESVRVLAFLCIRKLAILSPFPFIDDCLKGIYLNYVRSSVNVNTSSLALINFMCNCVIELYGLDFASSYRSAFVFIRQLAIHLRNSLNTNTKQAFQNIYNWQFINGIGAWVEIIAAYPNQEQLSLLLYPITQIIIGIINLIPSSRYIPLRFHCIRYLNRLAETNGTFINCTPYLLEILSCSEMKNQKTTKKNGFINFHTTLSASSTQLNSKEFQDGLLAQFCELLVENLTCFNYHIGFPELVTPIIIHIKKALKTKEYRPKVISDLQEILEAIEKTVKIVKTARDQVSFSPKETKQVQAFIDNLKDKYKITPLKQLLLSLKNKSKQLQKTLIESTKVYNYEDDEEEEFDSEDDEELEGEELEGDEEEFDGEDDDEEEEEEEEEKVYHGKKSKQPVKKQKTQPKFKVTGDGNVDDLVEDLVLSDDE
ncbi:hypothetical protein DICPUDRAFT_29382 [Dictyostelium purpureum]|uniref:Nucleolar complex protein 2 homolog n=1 Tax=Dictyostelium purpureum TaxID=5786 RepID=F0ZDI7_DICPU|nr:uncharacterized protein DICPUDRAFT_29382 [Dictyostelium purpureum]EGC38005.1 hypothetical protein DICPUDRAFT_29382 [Dictyostelium purpureum]|eukprot:XP_003285489.1 hypothetical protein DICPUDRAFT_29382 [Dictyostelium purpureum]